MTQPPGPADTRAVTGLVFRPSLQALPCRLLGLPTQLTSPDRDRLTQTKENRRCKLTAAQRDSDGEQQLGQQRPLHKLNGEAEAAQIRYIPYHA